MTFPGIWAPPGSSRALGRSIPLQDEVAPPNVPIDPEQALVHFDLDPYNGMSACLVNFGTGMILSTDLGQRSHDWGLRTRCQRAFSRQGPRLQGTTCFLHPRSGLYAHGRRRADGYGLPVDWRPRGCDRHTCPNEEIRVGTPGLSLRERTLLLLTRCVAMTRMSTDSEGKHHTSHR